MQVDWTHKVQSVEGLVLGILLGSVEAQSADRRLRIWYTQKLINVTAIGR